MEATEDFDNLDAVIGALNYPLGIFVNIDSVRTQAVHYADRIATAFISSPCVW